MDCCWDLTKPCTESVNKQNVDFKETTLSSTEQTKSFNNGQWDLIWFDGELSVINHLQLVQIDIWCDVDALSVYEVKGYIPAMKWDSAVSS